MPKQSEVLVELAESLKTLTDTVKGIESRLDKLEKPTDVKEPTPQVEVASVQENPLHRALVNEVLNKHFDFRVENDFSGTRLVVSVCLSCLLLSGR